MQCPPHPRPQQPGDQQIADGGHRESQEIQPLVLGQPGPRRWLRLVQGQAHGAAGHRFETFQQGYQEYRDGQGDQCEIEPA